MSAFVTLTCDKCGLTYPTSGLLPTTARREAKVDGWDQRWGLDLCPACIGDGEREPA